MMFVDVKRKAEDNNGDKQKVEDKVDRDFGFYRCRGKVPDFEMAKEMATRLWLVPLSGKLTRVELPQCDSVTSIGRDPVNAFIIPAAYAYVSREHCRIRSNLADTGEVVVEDLSANGTYVNAERVGKGRSKRLKCGDKISLAKPHRRGGALTFQLQRCLMSNL